MAELDLVESMYYEYMDYCHKNNKMRENPEGVQAFNEKYIYTLIKQNPKEGFEMEVMFHQALADTELRFFKNGFQACMNLIISSLVNDDFLDDFLDHFPEEEAET